MKIFSTFILCVLLSACGSEGGGIQGPLIQDPVALKGGKNGVTVITGTDSQGKPTVRYLGKIENNVGLPICRINIAFTSFNAQGTIIDQDLERKPEILKGTTLLAPVNADKPQELVATDSCLDIGESGVFDTGQLVLTEVFAENADFNFQLCVTSDSKKKACDTTPFIERPFISLGIPSLENLAIENQAGNRVFRGRVRSSVPADSPVDIAYDVRVHFTVLGNLGVNKGKIIDTSMAPISQIGTQGCPNGVPGTGGTGCLLGNGAEAEFLVTTQTLAAETCDTVQCYEFRIYHQETTTP